MHKLLELYCREIALSVENKVEKAIRFIKEILPNLRPKIIIDAEGNPAIGIDYVNSKSDIIRFLDEVFDLPQKLALKKIKILLSLLMNFRK